MVYESNVLTKRTKSKKFFQRSHFPSTLCLSLYLYLYIYVPHVYCAQSYLTLCNPMDSSPPVPLSMVFFKARILVVLPFLPPGDLPNPWIKLKFPEAPALQADSLPLSHQESTNAIHIYPNVKKS